MKLGLGTVQFGIDYGISNSSGRTSPDEVRLILELAEKLGIKFVDTATLYGTSEEVIGRMARSGHPFQIITKTPRFPAANITQNDVESLVFAFRRSLKLLKRPSVHGLMAHDADDLLKPGGELLFRAMEKLRSEGMVQRIGSSVYTGRQIDALRSRYSLGIVQAPVSILDQRLLVGGQLRALKDDGCEVHARSAFLQGVLLMDPADLPSHFNSVRAHLRKLRDRIDELRLTPLHAALGFVIGLPDVDIVVCGINNSAHLVDLGSHAVALDTDLSEFAIDYESVLNPSLWRK